jgi:hypothetical protein
VQRPGLAIGGHAVAIEACRGGFRDLVAQRQRFRMSGIVMHVHQAAHQLLVGIVAQPAGCQVAPALAVFADQDARLLQQIFVAVRALHPRHRLQPLPEYGVRIRAAPAAECAPRRIRRARGRAIAVQDVVIGKFVVEVAAGRRLPLPRTGSQGDARVIERLDHDFLVGSGLVWRRHHALRQRQ